jgi:hypothetical protein
VIRVMVHRRAFLPGYGSRRQGERVWLPCYRVGRSAYANA